MLAGMCWAAEATTPGPSLINDAPIITGISGMIFKKAVKNKSPNAKKVHIVKEEPKDCTYLADYSYPFNPGYANMFNGLRDAVVDIKGNYFVIDYFAGEGNPTMLYGRIFACP